MIGLLILFLSAFIPPVIYAVWIRNTEKYEREPWHAIFLAFLWGATIAVVMSLILEIIFDVSLYMSIGDYNITAFLMVVIVAPVVEEFSKPLALGLKKVRREINELEDGMIYGAAAGLGFSATENLFYEAGFLSEGLLLFLIFVAIRTIGGCLLHASATALTGYGYGRKIMGGKEGYFLHYFALAIAVHAFYNFLASLELAGGVVSIVLALSFAVLCIRYIRKRIRKMDEESEIRN